jgi:hypothetical protein
MFIQNSFQIFSWIIWNCMLTVGSYDKECTFVLNNTPGHLAHCFIFWWPWDHFSSTPFSSLYPLPKIHFITNCAGEVSLNKASSVKIKLSLFLIKYHPMKLHEPECPGFDSRCCVGIFHCHNPSGRTMFLGLTRPLTEMSTRGVCW